MNLASYKKDKFSAENKGENRCKSAVNASMNMIFENGNLEHSSANY